MARFKLPKKINGFRLPKPLRKQANKLIGRLQGEELEALLGVIAGVLITHLTTKEGETKLSVRLSKALGAHLAR